MKVIETDGIVLKTMDFKEKDCILTFLTTKAGKKAGILHGGKSLRSGNAAKAELFVLNHFEFSEKPNMDLVRIQKCELQESFPLVRKNYSKFLHASYFSELLLQCEIPELDSHEYFDLLKNAMSLLSESQTDTEIKLNFEIRLLNLLGITPNMEICFQCGGELWQERSGRNPAPKFSVPYQLDASSGGVRCPRCCIPSSYSAALHPGSLAFLHVKQNAKQSDSVFRPTQSNLEELDHALFVYFRHFFGQNLKSHALLKENFWKN